MAMIAGPTSERPMSVASAPVAELAGTADGALVELEHVIRIYREVDTETVALRGVDLRVARGEFVAVMGRSGSGKSTLLNLIAGADRPSAGRVVVNGVDIGRADDSGRTAMRGRVVGVVFQAQNLLPYLTLAENVELAAGLAGRSLRKHATRAALASVGLADRAAHRPSQLSGGEQQRAALCAVLATGPALLLGDEVTGELDSMTGRDVLDAIAAAHARGGLTVMLVTHDATVADRADRVVELRDGRVVADNRR